MTKHSGTAAEGVERSEPVNDTAFPFIEALVASGITAGCGGGDHCPDAPLTRRQMAVFLATSLGLHRPSDAP